ncbi:hypothetical protein SDJN02_08090, partial [Cucurbita argyrosperma subsp. argyrosperma]
MHAVLHHNRPNPKETSNSLKLPSLSIKSSKSTTLPTRFITQNPKKKSGSKQTITERSLEAKEKQEPEGGDKMCLVFVCDEDQRVLSRQPAPGACPFCGGMIQATDVESQWRFCFLPLYWKTKRKFYCTMCTRQLVIQ